MTVLTVRTISIPAGPSSKKGFRNKVTSLYIHKFSCRNSWLPTFTHTHTASSNAKRKWHSTLLYTQQACIFFIYFAILNERMIRPGQIITHYIFKMFQYDTPLNSIYNYTHINIYVHKFSCRIYSRIGISRNIYHAETLQQNKMKKGCVLKVAVYVFFIFIIFNALSDKVRYP